MSDLTTGMQMNTSVSRRAASTTAALLVALSCAPFAAAQSAAFYEVFGEGCKRRCSRGSAIRRSEPYDKISLRNFWISGVRP